MAWLIFATGPQAGRRLEVVAELVLGREEGDVVLDDAEVSRRHAAVRPLTGALEVADLGSLNGTWVNGARITRPTRLAAGDTLKVGATELTVEAEQLGGGRATVASPVPPAAAPAVPMPAFAPPPNPSRRSIATRRLTPMLLSVAVVVATALALVVYFAGR